MNTKKGLNCYVFSNLIITFLSLNFLINIPLSNELTAPKDYNTLSNVYESEVLANSSLAMSYNKSQTGSSTSTKTIRTSVSKLNVRTQNYISYIKPSYNSVTGSSLVEYAKHYLGLRYVYAGNSLTTGTDCSGFTRLIYKEFGITLGRTVGSQLYSGKYVSKSDLRPGDLVFYGNSRGYASHVGIYMGNGLIIHQSTPRDGVKISSVNIMVYITARRVITSNVTLNNNQSTKENNKTSVNKEEDKKVESKDTSTPIEPPKPESEGSTSKEENNKPELNDKVENQTPNDETSNKEQNSGEENQTKEKEESKEEPKTPTDDNLDKENTSGNDTVSDLDS